MTFQFRAGNGETDLEYPTTLYFDPRPFPSFHVIYKPFLQQTYLLYSVPCVWAFFSHTFCTFISFGCHPSLLVQMSFMAWQKGTFEVSGALVRRHEEQGAGRTPQRDSSPRDNSASAFELPLCFMRVSCTSCSNSHQRQVEEDQWAPQRRPLC